MESGRGLISGKRAAAILITFSLIFSALAFIPAVTGAGPMVSGGPNTTLEPTTTMVISANTVLTGNITAGNLTVEPGVSIYTDGYSILCSGNFTNYGTIFAGQSRSGNYSLSYGGSGGGAYTTVPSSLLGLTGFSTLSPGGKGTSRNGQVPGNGSTPNPPSLSSSLISEWYSKGIQNYLSGASGQGLSYFAGGNGSNGIYVQANDIVNRGIINANGNDGAQINSGNYSGSGGGGVVLLAYGHSLTEGVVQVKGGTSVTGVQFYSSGSRGGNGQVMTFRYGTYEPVQVKNPTVVYLPPWAFPGAVLNFSLSTNFNNNNTTGYVQETINSVSMANQTFSFTEKSLTSATPGSAPSIFRNTAQYYGAPTFPALSVSDLTDLEHNNTKSALILDQRNWNVVASNLTVKVKAGTFRTIEINSGSPAMISTSANITVWVDMKTGIIVKLTEKTNPGPSQLNNVFSSTIELDSTNIVYTSTLSVPLILSLIVIIPVISLIIIARAYAPGMNRKEEPQMPSTGLHMLENTLRERTEELRIMLEKGLITREYYDETLKRLAPQKDQTADEN